MIVVVSSHPIEMAPPVISFIKIVRRMREDISFIGLTYTLATKSVLRELKIPFALRAPWPSVKFREHPVRRLWFALRKRLGVNDDVFSPTIAKRRFIWQSIRKFANYQLDDVVVVSTSMITASLLGDDVIPFGHRHVHWVLELGDRHGFGFTGFDAKKFFASATVVTSEINRSRIFKDENHLGEMPITLPNKSWGHPRKRNLQVADLKVAKIVKTWSGKVVFLYQGSLGVDRNGVVELLEWLSEEFPESVVAIMTGFCPPAAQEIIRDHHNMVIVPHVTAPHHLEVTSYATIGVAMYVANKVKGLSDQNAIHCAPNKTFECTGFGIPLLCNDIPGLVDSVGVAGAALCVPFERDKMMAAAHQLLENYDFYSANATKFFDSVDEVAIVKKILEKARS